MNRPTLDQLVSDLQPVQRLRSPFERAVGFGVAALVLLGLAVSLHVRSDLGSKLADVSFGIETAVLFVLFGAATHGALASGVPGARLGPASRLAALAFGVWLVVIALRYAPETAHSGLASGAVCLRRLLLLGLPAAAVLGALVKRSAPLKTGASGLLVMLSAAALAVLGTHLLCAKDEAVHVFIWHCSPLLVAATLGSLVGRSWLRPGCSSG